MQLAGLKKSSLIDYPEKISCVVFLTGCNFKCPYCHNPDLALGRYPERIAGTQLMSLLEQRQLLLDGVVITGGEPTLDPNLPELCHTIRSLGYKVKLDTNGSRPKVLARLIQDGVIDYIAMDIKTAVDDYGPPICEIQLQTKIAQSIDLVMACGLDYEFRTTCVRPFVDEDIIERIAKTIKGARQYTLQGFNETTLLQVSYFQGSQKAGFTPDQMLRLQTLAAPYVQKCCLR